MADTDLRSREDAAPSTPAAERPRLPDLPPRRRSRIRILPLLLTLIAIAAAVWLGRGLWRVYMEAPWTRDGTVRAYVVTIAPEVADRIVKLPVADNQFVHKGDLLMVIDPTDYKIAVDLAQAAVEQAQVNAQNAEREAQRRQELTRLAVTKEEKQTYESTAVADQAALQQAVARLAQARVNLQRTEIRSPVNGYVTNLLVQLGDYATVGKNLISIVDVRFILGRRLFRRNQHRPHPRRRPRDDKVDGLPADHPRPCRQYRPRHQCRQRRAERAGCRRGQPDLHLGAARPAHSGAHPHR